MLKQNLHTHSVYCDGKDTLEEMIIAAIDKGFTNLGFSGHGYVDIDDGSMSLEGTKLYQEEIKQLKEKYKGQIDIHLGLEEDMLYRYDNPETFEYMIGSKHFIHVDHQDIAVDYDEETFMKLLKLFHYDFIELAKNYYESLKKLALFDEVKIIGHLDLLMKYNDKEKYCKFNNSEYLKYAYDCIDVLISANKIFEVNTGAIARGVRTLPYPYKNLLKYIYEKGGKVILNSDCHNKEYLDCGYDLSLNIIKECGFTTLEYLTDDGFISVDINEFKGE